MAKVSKKPVIYSASEKAFAKTASGKLIPNTSFYAGKEDDKYFSLKNKTAKISSGKITSILSDKIAKAVLSSQVCDENSIMGWGKHDGEEFVVGQFSGGSAHDLETFIVIPGKKEIITTNINSHLFYKVVLGFDLLNLIKKGDKSSDEDKEVLTLMEKMRNLPTSAFDETAGMLVDSSDAEVFIPLCDSIYHTAKLFDGFNVRELEEGDGIFGEYLENIQYNILPLMAMYSSEDLTLELYEKEVPEIHVPKIKRKKGSKSSTPPKKVAYDKRDYSLMSDDDALKLPNELQRSRKIAMELFDRNKATITQELWEAISSFYNGKIWKMGFYGPSASGKTTFIKMMAGALQLPFAIVTGNGETEKGDLFGTMQVNEKGTFFCEGSLTQIMRYGGIFLFDERNMVNAGVVAATNNILDDTRMYTIPQTGETLIAHPLFRYCEAFNVGYEGTRDDNISHISRIQEWHKMSGFDEKREAEIVAKETGIDMDTATKMIHIKNKVSTQIMTDGDESTQRMDLRSVIAWAQKAMDIEDIVRASLTTVLTPLAKDVDTVLASATEKDFQASGDPVVDFAMAEIKNQFGQVVKKIKTKDYEFETYSLA